MLAVSYLMIGVAYMGSSIRYISSVDFKRARNHSAFAWGAAFAICVSAWPIVMVQVSRRKAMA